MKRATRGWLRDQCVGMTYAHGRAQDALESDARQRAEIRDLKARLRAAESLPRARNLHTDARCFDLANKKWRKL